MKADNFMRIGDKWINADEISAVIPGEAAGAEVHFKGVSETVYIRETERKELCAYLNARFGPKDPEPDYDRGFGTR